jgi:glutamyl-tRNA synthetase
LAKAYDILDSLPNWDKESLESALKELITKKNWNTGEFFMNLRIAITGSKFTPPITDSMVILGKEKSLFRIKAIISLL